MEKRMRAVVIVSRGGVEGLEVREVERLESNASFGKIVLKISDG